MSSSEPIRSAMDRPFLWAIHGFFICAVLTAGCMFTYKLFEFMQTIKRDDLAGFAFDPIMIYGSVAMGFLFLLGWAYMTGQFRNVEQPKHDMLKRFDEQERAEGSLPGEWSATDEYLR